VPLSLFLQEEQVEKHLASIWESIADRIPGEVALVHGGRTRSWREFDERSARFGQGLLDAGVEVGSVVGMSLYNYPEYLEAFFGIIKVGAVPANVNYRYVEEEIRFLLADCGAKAVVFDSGLGARMLGVAREMRGLRLIQVESDGFEAVEGVPTFEQLVQGHEPAVRRRRSGDEFYLSYTGGTTGLPKGVVLQMDKVTQALALDSRGWILGLPEATISTDSAQLAALLTEAGNRPVALPASPLVHGAGLGWGSLPALTAGGTVVTLPGRSFDAHAVLETIARRRVTAMTIVGDAFARPLVHALDGGAEAGTPYDVSSLRVISSGGAPWSAESKKGLLRHVPNVALVDGCGCTEGGTYGIKVLRQGDEISTTSFECLPGTRVLDEHGRDLPPGTVGLLAAVRYGSGYYREAERTRQVFRTIDGVDYIVPGDYGRVESDGTLTFLGRDTTTINTGGEKVFAEEVAAAIRSLPAVENCAVVGAPAPTERFGQIVTAVVQPRAGASITLEEIADHCRQHLAAYKVPRRLVVVDAIPTTSNGKADLQRLQQLVTSST
jgi:fatty-acyl-CoA synthase